VACATLLKKDTRQFSRRTLHSSLPPIQNSKLKIQNSKLITMSVIDLTHSLKAGIPVWPGETEIDPQAIATIDRDGYFVQELKLGEHSGTHFGAAAHFHADEPFADELPPESFIRKAVKIDVRERCAGDRDYRLKLDDVIAWERYNGRIRAKSAVLLETGWSDRWNDRGDYFGFDGKGGMHFPGYSLDAARFLAEERGVVGLGIDTAGIDAGCDRDFSVNSYWLRGERFHLENLTNLAELPERGFTIMIGVLKIARSSGGPARVFGMV
jgi:kynurenine formamidase